MRATPGDVSKPSAERAARFTQNVEGCSVRDCPWRRWTRYDEVGTHTAGVTRLCRSNRNQGVVTYTPTG
jgi:hypothetical protein